MALQLSKTLSNDYLCEFAIITRITIDFINKKSMLNLAFYKEFTSYQSSKSPVEVQTFEFNDQNFIFDPVALRQGSPLDLAYQVLSSNPDLNGAVVIPDSGAAAKP